MRLYGQFHFFSLHSFFFDAFIAGFLIPTIKGLDYHMNKVDGNGVVMAFL